MSLNYFDKEKIRNTVGVLNGCSKFGARRLSTVLWRDGDMDISKEGELRPFAFGETWGGFDQTAWFRIPIEIPADMDGKNVWIEINCGRNGWNATNPQFLAYLNGKPVQGLDMNHLELQITAHAKKGGHYTVDLDAWSGMTVREASWFDNENSPCFLKVKLYCLDEPVESLYYDIKVPLEVASALPEGDSRRVLILRHLWEAVNLLDLRKPGSEEFHMSVEAASEYMEKEFYGKVCGESMAEAYCVGHTHIDVAWLWTYAHTRKKAARSFATALSLMDSYPDFVFMSSQPQLYQFVKEDHPDLYARIKERAADGRWDPEGGMWLEADCNLTSGESLVRQFVYGKRFFREEFGVDSKILWLPDVFGYSAALPQICKKCGIDYFMTTKISWNEMNQIPYDSFYWKGIDGTKILTHFIPTRPKAQEEEHKSFFTTYNGVLDAANIMGGWDRYQQKALNQSFMVSYGYGDGGGGATKEMVENGKRLAKGIPGCPTVKNTRTLDYFRMLEHDLDGQPRVPEWFGELYLEYHRGTYTSIAKNKRNNRKAEFGLEQAETLALMAETTAVSEEYPAQALKGCWETVLLNQFHDVLPGSSIKAVYEDTDKLYQKVFHEMDYIVDDSARKIAAQVRRTGDGLVVFNTLGFARDSIVTFTLPGKRTPFHLSDGTERVPVQLANGAENTYLFRAMDLPAGGYRFYRIEEGEAEAQAVKAEGRRFSNGLIEVEFDETGAICSLMDLEENRQVLPEGSRANVLETYEDRPHNYEAWDINVYYRDKEWTIEDLESFSVVENGPVRTVIRVSRKYLESSIVQDIMIYPDSKRIDFETHVDWNQQQILLKAAFPVDVLAPQATYEIQYGSVERPTHTNTEWDFAKFETCAQKWADLSETGYGVSILNDCKYGHDIHDGVIRLTLLKSAVNPNPDADKGKHVFTYSILPHGKGWREAGTPRQAYDLNVPAVARAVNGAGGILSPEFSLFGVESQQVNMEVIKKAEDGDGLVARCYEAFGGRCEARFTFALDDVAVYECDMLEHEEHEIQPDGHSFTVSFYPYEIKTFKLVKKA